MDFVRLARDVVSDEWDLPEVEYLSKLDVSDFSSRKVLEDVSKEAARKMLAHFATKASTRLLSALMEQLEKLTLPDSTGKSQAFIGEVDYETSNSKIARAQRPNSSVTLEGSRLKWSVTEVGLQSVGDWAYKMAGGLVNDKGTYELSMAGMGFDFEADIVKKAGGGGDDGSDVPTNLPLLHASNHSLMHPPTYHFLTHPSSTHHSEYDLELGNCVFQKGSPDLQFGGSPGCVVLQCLFQNAILPGLKEKLPENLSSAVKDLVFNIAPILKQFHAYWPLAMGVIEVSRDLIKTIRDGL